jgi:hypothetical protein
MNDIYQSRRAKLLKYYEYLVYLWIILIIYALIFEGTNCWPENSSNATIDDILAGHKKITKVFFFTGIYLLVSYFIKIPAPGFNQFIKFTFLGAFIAFISIQIRC